MQQKQQAVRVGCNMTLIKSLIGSIPTVLVEVRQTFKESGFKGVFKRYGWKIFAAFFVYYLIRDTILYILIPYWVAQKLLS